MTEYGRLSAAYATYILSKLDFHKNHVEVEGTISLDKYIETNKTFSKPRALSLVTQLLDLQQAAVDFEKFFFKQKDLLDCKISVMIPLVIESYNIYALTVHLLKQLAKAKDDDDVFLYTVERFNNIYQELRQFFFTCSNIKYITQIIAVPILSDTPPSFIHTDTPVKKKNPKSSSKESLDQPQENPFIAPSEPIWDANLFQQPVQSNMMDMFTPQTDPKYDELLRKIEELERRIRELEARIRELEEENHRLRLENERLRSESQMLRFEKEESERNLKAAKEEAQLAIKKLQQEKEEWYKREQMLAQSEDARLKSMQEENLRLRQEKEEWLKKEQLLKQSELEAQRLKAVQEENERLKKEKDEWLRKEQALLQKELDAQAELENMILLKALSGPNADQLKLLNSADERVRAFMQQLLNAAKNSETTSDIDTVDLEDIAERELLNAAKVIEDAAKLLELQNAKRIQESPDGELDVSSIIMSAAMAITKATEALIKAAAEAQKERIEKGNFSDPNSRYHKDPMWVEGLISAAKAVAEATRLLVSSANDACEGRVDEAALIAASKAVASSTAQLVAATRVKSSDPYGPTQKNLDNAASAVSKATAALVKAAQNSIQSQEEKILMRSQNIAEGVKQEIDQQAKILRLEKELESERNALFALRKQKYAESGDVKQ